jgi:MFS family permease
MQANVWKYYLYHCFLNLQLWLPIWVIYLTEERGLSLAQVTLIDVPFWLCIIFLQIPGAAIADRWGRKPTLMAAAATLSLAIVLFGLAASFWLILGSYLIWGIGFSLLYGTESAFIYDSLKAEGRESEYPKVYGRGWAVAMAATLVGTLLGAPVAAATSLPFPIVLSGAISALAVLVALMFREPLPQVRTRQAMAYGEIIAESLVLLRRDAHVRYAILFYGVITVGSIAPIFFFQPFLLEHGVGLGEVGVWQTPMRIAGILGALVAHRLIAALGERWTFYMMPVTLIVSYALLATWDSIYAQIAFPIINFSVVLSQPTVTDYLNRRVPTEQRATIVSLTNLIRSVVLIPSAPLLGLLADEASTSAAFAAGGIIVAAVGLPLLLLWLPAVGRGRVEEPVVPAGRVAPGGD